MNGRIVRLASAWMFCIILAGCEGDSGNDTSSAADVPDASAPDGTLSDTAPDDTLPDTTAADVPAETGADTPLPDGTNDTPPGDEGLPGDAVVDGFVEDVASPDPGTADTGLPDLPPDEGQPDVIDLPCAGIGPLEWSAEAILSLNWQAAVAACESLGEGWRMPDICEMRAARSSDARRPRHRARAASRMNARISAMATAPAASWAPDREPTGATCPPTGRVHAPTTGHRPPTGRGRARRG